MLTLNSSEEKHSTCFKFIGMDNTPTTTHLLTDNTSLILSASDSSCMDSCSFYSGPSDATIIAFGESCGSIAYSGSESCGTIAYSGGNESCGSIASSSVSSCSSFSGGGCSYSC